MLKNVSMKQLTYVLIYPLATLIGYMMYVDECVLKG